MLAPTEFVEVVETGESLTAESASPMFVTSLLRHRGLQMLDTTRSSACGWPEVVCLRMARGRLLADGPRSSACGWFEVVCGWLEVVCGRLRMARGRLPADGPCVVV